MLAFSFFRLMVFVFMEILYDKLYRMSRG